MKPEYKIEFDRYLYHHKDEFSNEVVEYGESFLERLNDNIILKTYFDMNHIGIYPFLSALLPASEYKFQSIGGEYLDENEINQVFGTVILNNEILRLTLNDDALIRGVNDYGELVYELTEDAMSYFRGKYGVNINKTFSMRDIIIVRSDNDTNDESTNKLN